MNTEKTNAAIEVSTPPNVADPVVAPEMEGVSTEGEVSMKAEEEVPIPTIPPPEPISQSQPGNDAMDTMYTGDITMIAQVIEGAHGHAHGQASAKAEEEIPIPLPPRLSPRLSARLSLLEPPYSQPTSQPSNEVMATMNMGEITIMDQDVLFGRGGLTNRHIGNLRYRDIIIIHRQDYVRAQKTEKPNVARRIVKAIRTGKHPGRFLRKGEDGRWHAVSDKEAAWKASQALREKSRWSSMKQDDKQASPSAAEITLDLTFQNVMETAGATSAQKRAAVEDIEEHGAVLEMKKAKIELPIDPPLPLPVEAVPTEISHIAVPPVDTLGSTKQVGANYILHPTMNCDIFPRDEDVLFGRGGRTNHHPGNKRLREIVNKYRDTYHQAKKVDKPKVSKLIVSALRSAIPPSRFLRMNEESSRGWEDVGDKRAAEKVSQTLREKDRHAKMEYVARRTIAQLAQPVSEAAAYDAAPQAVPEETTMAQVEDVQVGIPSPEKFDLD